MWGFCHVRRAINYCRLFNDGTAVVSVATLTVQAVMALALHCGIPRSVAPVIVGIAQHESGLDPDAKHGNANGTLDAGLAQINSSNWGWLGIHSLAEALEPCRNLQAGVRVLFARYNGAPPPSVAIAYAADVTAKIDRVAVEATAVPIAVPSPTVITPGDRIAGQPPPAWEVWTTTPTEKDNH